MADPGENFEPSVRNTGQKFCLKCLDTVDLVSFAGDHQDRDIDRCDVGGNVFLHCDVRPCKLRIRCSAETILDDLFTKLGSKLTTRQHVVEHPADRLP